MVVCIASEPTSKLHGCMIVYNALVLVLLVVIAVSSFILDLTVNLNITAVTGNTMVFIDLGEMIIGAGG